MTSIELDTVRGGSEQTIEHISQPQSRDVTRVVKILKQNEPLVSRQFSVRNYLNISRNKIARMLLLNLHHFYLRVLQYEMKEIASLLVVL